MHHCISECKPRTSQQDFCRPCADKQHRCHRVSRKEGPGCQTLSRQKGCADSHQPCASSRGAVTLPTTGGPHEGPPYSSCHSARVRARPGRLPERDGQLSPLWRGRRRNTRTTGRQTLQSRPSLCPAGTGQYGLGMRNCGSPEAFPPNNS